MSAQTAQEPSMEDILASIRKIISEDNKDDAVSDVAPTPVAVAKPPVGELPVRDVKNTPVRPAPAQTPSLVERREMQYGDVSATPEMPADNTPPFQSGNVTSQKPFDPPYGSAAIPGFVERKPDTPIAPSEPEGNIFQTTPENAPAQVETPLHPAIANAKAFVSSNIKSGDEPALGTGSETPVFENSKAIGVQTSTTPLVSPDSVERRDEEERRNHPLRRGADREGEEFRNALMSPGADDAVVSAFEQLKNSATDNLDGKVEALLRPMLREWLDNNLPSMVERLVRDEIERVSRGD